MGDALLTQVLPDVVATAVTYSDQGNIGAVPE